ncbi:Protein of unknown function [Bowdeniella nasicola]|uniref:DUF3093 domain-containing protein n=1 Tax=Bowdeniella nasicola TaxID=208480 RepID=A0A1H3WDV3_9ACTO|nr:Protein of unknown function [Bowdeniella nasicola]
MCHSKKVTATRYSSRLTPPPLMMIVLGLLGASFGLIFVPVSTTLAWIVAVIGGLVVVGLLIGSAPVTVVEDGELKAGGAHIPLHFLTTAEELDAPALREAMGPAADTRAWVVHRPWASSAVKVGIDDPRDPTPYWLLCVKDPHRLVQVLHESAVH